MQDKDSKEDKESEEYMAEDKCSNYESEDDDNDFLDDYYEWVMIPSCNPDDRKTGVTFKGDTEEYL